MLQAITLDKAEPAPDAATAHMHLVIYKQLPQGSLPSQAFTLIYKQ